MFYASYVSMCVFTGARVGSGAYKSPYFLHFSHLCFDYNICSSQAYWLEVGISVWLLVRDNSGGSHINLNEKKGVYGSTYPRRSFPSRNTARSTLVQLCE